MQNLLLFISLIVCFYSVCFPLTAKMNISILKDSHGTAITTVPLFFICFRHTDLSRDDKIHAFLPPNCIIQCVFCRKDEWQAVAGKCFLSLTYPNKPTYLLDKQSNLFSYHWVIFLTFQPSSFPSNIFLSFNHTEVQIWSQTRRKWFSSRLLMRQRLIR